MNKEEQIQEHESKQLIDELSKMPPMVLATAYLHAINYTLYGEDVTEKWVTATQNTCALEKAYRKGYYDALQRQAESEESNADIEKDKWKSSYEQMYQEKIYELNKRKEELENQLNISVQDIIENKMIMCCEDFQTPCDSCFWYKVKCHNECVNPAICNSHNRWEPKM